MWGCILDIGLGDYLRGFSRSVSSAAGTLEPALEWELQAFAERARQGAVSLSSGGYSLEALARLGHPYAKRHPNPPQDPAIINRQTGLFLRSWRTTPLERTLAGLGIKVVNDAPYADYLDQGTSLMIRRPIIERLEQRLAPDLLLRIRTALGRWWRVPYYQGAITLSVGSRNYTV